jgi:hypothetical protein
MENNRAVRYQAVLETQSYGHYTESGWCNHAHRTMQAATNCASAWERREERIRIEQGEIDNGARFIAKELAHKGGSAA